MNEINFAEKTEQQDAVTVRFPLVQAAVQVEQPKSVEMNFQPTRNPAALES